MFKDIVKQRLKFIYNDIDEQFIDRYISIAEEAKLDIEPKKKWDESDVVLITYGDSMLDGDKVPLQVLNTFLKSYLKDEISCVHILPFFPFSSDDGFSVIDYNKVDENLGNWDDVSLLNKNFDIMADLVINHISQHSEWFKKYLKGDEQYKDFFVEADPTLDYSKVVRPRSLPLLTPVETAEGEKHVWTTFSADQIDLNFAHPEVLLKMTEVLLLYMKMGTRIIRLDAIAFLWKELGTSCLHLPQTHEVVKLLRDVMEFVNPNAIMLTETNVPNKENLSYFGDGDEAHMVYQFSLPPLLLHALHTGNSSYLADWAKSLPQINDDCTYFNFTASHDGIGVRPLEGLLPQDEFDQLVENMKHFGGKVSTKRNSDGTDSPYELNITYFDACKGTKAGADELQIARFLCSQTILLAVKGVPALYIHSITATPNYYEGVEKSGRARTINRMKWDINEYEEALSHNSAQKIVLEQLKKRISIRKSHSAFNPSSKQEIIETPQEIFAVKRSSSEEVIECISNVSNKETVFEITSEKVDLLSQHIFKGEVRLKPYQTLWLKEVSL